MNEWEWNVIGIPNRRKKRPILFHNWWQTEQNRTEKIPYHFECQVFVFSFHFESNGDVTKKNCLMEINFGSLNPYNVQCSIRNQRIFF